MRAVGDRGVFRAGAPDHPASIVALNLASARHFVLKKATDILDRTDLHLGDYLTRVESVEFPTTGGGMAFRPLSLPRNPLLAQGEQVRPSLLCLGPPRTRPGASTPPTFRGS